MKGSAVTSPRAATRSIDLKSEIMYEREACRNVPARRGSGERAPLGSREGDVAIITWWRSV